VLGLPRSHRKRVRLAWWSAGTIALLTIVGLIVFVPNTGHSTATPINEHQPAQVFHPPKTVKATAAQKAAALATIDRFARSAIIRRNLEGSWPLATPHMKLGVSHADWLAGDLPVVPYPAWAFRTAGYTLKGQFKGVLDYDVLMLPKETQAAQRDAGQQVYSCELHELRGTWLVDSCYPRKTL
jgi:hypothetical protein